MVLVILDCSFLGKMCESLSVITNVLSLLPTLILIKYVSVILPLNMFFIFYLYLGNVHQINL